MAFFTKEQHQVLATAKAKIRAAKHPLRERIMVLIKEKNNTMYVQEIYKALREEQSVTSSHLGILRKAGLIIPKRENQRIYYSLSEDAIQHLLKTCDILVGTTEPAPIAKPTSKGKK